jgi:hypothetical protein
MARIDDVDGDHRAREAIETAMRRTPFCVSCGRPTTPVADRHALRLECTGLRETRPILRRLRELDLGAPHTRQLLLDAA